MHTLASGAPNGREENPALRFAKDGHPHWLPDLMEWRGEVGQSEESGINFLDDFAVGFGFVAEALPFGIVAEGFPVGGGGFLAGMSDDVDQSLAFQRFVEGRPVGDVFHSMFFEERHGVFSKTAQQVVQLAFVGVVDAEFVDHC